MTEHPGRDGNEPGGAGQENLTSEGSPQHGGTTPLGPGWSPQPELGMGAVTSEAGAPTRARPQGDAEKRRPVLRLLRIAAVVVLVPVIAFATYVVGLAVLILTEGGPIRPSDRGPFLAYFVVDLLAVFGLAKLLSRGRPVSGEVRGFQMRQEAGMGGLEVTVWSFRLERYDDGGNRLPPVPVEMRAKRFRGSISDGDWLEARGRLRFGRTLHPRRVWNRTTGALVKSTGAGRAGAIGCALLVLALVFLALIRACGGHAAGS